MTTSQCKKQSKNEWGQYLLLKSLKSTNDKNKTQCGYPKEVQIVLWDGLTTYSLVVNLSDKCDVYLTIQHIIKCFFLF